MNTSLSFFDGSERPCYDIPMCGEYAHDRESGEKLVVISVEPGTSAGSYNTDELGGQSEKYNPDAPPVYAVPVRDIEEAIGQTTDVEEIRHLTRHGKVSSQKYQADRLAETEVVDV